MVDFSNRVQVRAFLLFHPNRAQGLRNAPALHGIVKRLEMGRLPDALWALVVVDRDGDQATRTVSVRMIGPDGSTVGETMALDVDRDSDEVVVTWRRIPMVSIFRGAGLYLGEVLIDGSLAAVCRLPISPPA